MEEIIEKLNTVYIRIKCFLCQFFVLHEKNNQNNC